MPAGLPPALIGGCSGLALSRRALIGQFPKTRPCLFSDRSTGHLWLTSPPPHLGSELNLVPSGHTLLQPNVCLFFFFFFNNVCVLIQFPQGARTGQDGMGVW